MESPSEGGREVETRASEARQEAAGAGLSDEQVVGRVLAGETELFELLMRRYNQRIYRTVRSLLGSEAEAEEVMQQSYAAAFEHLAEFRGGARFSTWLVRIAVNEALGRLRRRGRHERWLASVDPDTEQELGLPGLAGAAPRGPEEEAMGRELLAVLEAAVDRLPADHRAVFVLREVERLSTAEAAEVLGVSEEALRVRLHRARLALREELLDQVDGVAVGAFPFGATRCDRVVAAVMARLSAAPRPG
jgi:RNA polymerase sigma-70 factor (ECF subfamily)